MTVAAQTATRYVYGIVREGLDLRPDLGGLTDTPGSVQTVGVDGVAAVVGPAPEDLRARRRHLLAHQHVLDTVLAAGTVLPMRFGVVAQDDDVRRVLAERGPELGELLTRLDGMVEMNVKAFHREDAVLPELVRSSREIQRLRERAVQTGGYGDQLALGEAVAAALEGRRREDASGLLDALTADVVEVAPGATPDGGLLNVSFLVRRAELPDFVEAVYAVQARHRERIELRTTGPLPPYSFVSDLELSWA